MNAILNIYKDCTSEEPTKVYVCKRLTLGVSKKVQALSDNMKDKDNAEQQEIIIDVLKSIFPNFDANDFDGIDPVEYAKFIRTIGEETARIQGLALKNQRRAEL